MDVEKTVERTVFGPFDLVEGQQEQMELERKYVILKEIKTTGEGIKSQKIEEIDV